ncbi:tRNA 2-thiouridine(34) synthase MnmA [Candidatus Poriferisodalis sp.]|uniref:tRNA 2-thiouridine(34) synthase MnmA n=1 Tax=Candidatus Poriferisodalis sp. TaxID=3101277 RepID=UPI003B02676F
MTTAEPRRAACSGLDRPSARRRVLVAMSGGVDSSVAAALCVREGREVVGVTLKLWGGPQDQGCCAVSDVDDARRVCQQLGIDHFVFNYAAEFERDVVAPYADAHRRGLTPNPCIACNRHVKFDVLLQRARRLGFEQLVTGHHVRISRRSGRLRLRRGADAAKDQSYVLYMLSEADLALLQFPLGDMRKADARALAAELGLRTADKPDSQDVCFITEAAGRERFLAERIDLHPAELVDCSGRHVGTVPAVELVTVGQRKGLDLGGAPQRRYAVEVDVEARRVTVGGRGELSSRGIRLVDHRWVGALVEGEVLAQTSAHGPVVPASLDAQGQLHWSEPQRRVAGGQAVVFYQGDEVLGGATSAGHLT